MLILHPTRYYGIRRSTVKKLLVYLQNYKKETVLGPLFKLFEATLELIVPLVVASVIDEGISEGRIGYVAAMCGVLAALGLVGLCFSVTAQYFSAKAAVGFVTEMRHGLFSHLQTLSYSDVDRLGTSTMITRMTTDSSRVQSGLNLALRLLLRSPFVVFGAMIMAFIIDEKSGISFAVTIPVLSIIVFGIMFLTTPLYKKVQNGVDKILTRTRENLAGVRVIRAFGKEDNESCRFRDENEALTVSQKKAGHISALLNPMTYVVINLGIIFLIYTGALRVNEGDLSQGEVIALYNYMSQILVELIKLANLIVSITKALASASRISAVLDIVPTQSYGEVTEWRSSEYAVEFNDVSLRYAGAGDNSLENISFKVRPGETVGIIGGTGSGKSSLANLIPRFYDPTDGEVLVGGTPSSKYAKGVLTSKIGVVPQNAVLFSGTIRDNMKWLAPDATDEQILEAIDIAQATDVIAAKGGLDAEVAGRGRNFSGGQRQRLTIARALVGKPEILILDDSASALDFATDARLREAIRTRLGDSTVFIISQRAASVMHADKIIVLDDGRVAAIGKHDELIRDCDAYREIYESQFKKEAAV